VSAGLQPVVIVPADVWAAWTARIECLEARERTKTADTATTDTILTSRQAAEFLGLKGGPSVTKARRAGRLTGMLINEKEWGFRTSELTRYLHRYKRAKP
jgi:hypothetical protein